MVVGSLFCSVFFFSWLVVLVCNCFKRFLEMLLYIGNVGLCLFNDVWFCGLGK